MRESESEISGPPQAAEAPSEEIEALRAKVTEAEQELEEARKREAEIMGVWNKKVDEERERLKRAEDIAREARRELKESKDARDQVRFEKKWTMSSLRGKLKTARNTLRKVEKKQ